MDSVYYCVITLTTVGFGDFVVAQFAAVVYDDRVEQRGAPPGELQSINQFYTATPKNSELTTVHVYCSVDWTPRKKRPLVGAQ